MSKFIFYAAERTDGPGKYDNAVRMDLIKRLRIDGSIVEIHLTDGELIRNECGDPEFARRHFDCLAKLLGAPGGAS